MNFGDFKEDERNMNLDGVTVPESNSWFDDFSFNEATETAGSWIDSLGNTFLKVKQLENAVKGGNQTPSDQNEQLQRSYEQTMQGQPSSSAGGFQFQQKHLIYAGIGLAAFMVIKG